MHKLISHQHHSFHTFGKCIKEDNVTAPQFHLKMLLVMHNGNNRIVAFGTITSYCQNTIISRESHRLVHFRADGIVISSNMMMVRMFQSTVSGTER